MKSNEYYIDIWLFDNYFNLFNYMSAGIICSICPVFTLSSVSGLHLNLLKTFLNVLPPLQSSNEREKYMQELSEFQVDEVYSIPSVGVVAAGNVLR